MGYIRSRPVHQVIDEQRASFGSHAQTSNQTSEAHVMSELRCHLAARFERMHARGWRLAKKHASRWKGLTKVVHKVHGVDSILYITLVEAIIEVPRYHN